MNTQVNKVQDDIDELYDNSHWHVNTGGETIHAKRMSGWFRNAKWITASVWLTFFLGPYLRWGDRQAILFDIPDRQFHILGLTILPQDVWMLSLVLLFFAILLAVVTSIAGRIFCGFFCFQTVWTDVFTWIEEKLEGSPAQRRKLDKGPLNWDKLKVKVPKHTLWLLIAMLTGVSFSAWFVDVYALWEGFFTLQAPFAAWVVLAMFTVGTYVLAGYMREQVCFWLCPYARIQGVMYDRETILPAYDFARGEPRGKLKKDDSADNPQGHCIDCNQCVAVCPTGIDIRKGQQEGCITCGLCIDACDSVMDKIERPRGLIRYASLDELEGKPAIPLFKRPRVIVYTTILFLALVGIGYGLANIGGLELKVLHERQPLFVQQSDGSIQNKYYVKVLNKTDKDMPLNFTASGPQSLHVIGAEAPLVARSGGLTSFTIFLRIPSEQLGRERTPVMFRLQAVDDPAMETSYETMFFGPRS